MAELLIRVSDGFLATVITDGHQWGTCECWPKFVVLHVQGNQAAILETIDASRDGEGITHVALDVLRDQVVDALADEDRATIPLNELQFFSGGLSAKLVAATVSRAEEKVAFEDWHTKLGDLGDAPGDQNRRAAEQAAHANLVAKRGGVAGGVNTAPPKKGARA